MAKAWLRNDWQRPTLLSPTYRPFLFPACFSSCCFCTNIVGPFLVPTRRTKYPLLSFTELDCFHVSDIARFIRFSSFHRCQVHKGIPASGLGGQEKGERLVRNETASANDTVDQQSDPRPASFSTPDTVILLIQQNSNNCRIHHALGV